MIRYTKEKYERPKSTSFDKTQKVHEDWNQQHIAEALKSKSIVLLNLELYPTNNFIIVKFVKPGKELSTTISIYQPQVWFLNFIHQSMPNARKAMEFYVKHSSDVHERYAWDGISKELKTWVMAVTLSEGS